MRKLKQFQDNSGTTKNILILRKILTIIHFFNKPFNSKVSDKYTKCSFYMNANFCPFHPQTVVSVSFASTSAN